MKRAASNAVHDPLIGSTIGSYVVERLVGQGGMGTVYEVCHPTIGKRLALKLLHPEHSQKPDILQRFFDEARAVNLIRHPNIVDIIDFSRLADGRSYIMMEYLAGDTLSEYLRRAGALPLGEVRDIALPICSALGAAHHVGITHRDLKPDNVHLIAHPDGSRSVKVLDFGIAKLSDEHRLDPYSPGTRDGVVMGTPVYMSPEQAMGKVREIDARTDVYALGIMLYEMLAGRVPFSSDSFAALIISHLQERPPLLRTLRPDLPEEWETLVNRALQKRPDQRFQSMAELATAIQDAAHTPSPAVARRPPTGPVLVPPAPEPAQRPITTITSGQRQPRAARSRLALPLGIGAILAITIAIVMTILAGGGGDDVQVAPPAPAAASQPVAASPPAASDAAAPAVPVVVAPDAGAVVAPDAAPERESSSERRRRRERERERERRERAEEAAILAGGIDEPATRDAGGPAHDAGEAEDKDADHDKPKPDPEEKAAGSLKITASPWADVKVDGNHHGQTPIEIDLLPGRHRIVLTNSELGTRKVESIKIEPGRRREISVDMREE